MVSNITAIDVKVGDLIARGASIALILSIEYLDACVRFTYTFIDILYIGYFDRVLSCEMYKYG